MRQRRMPDGGSVVYSTMRTAKAVADPRIPSKVALRRPDSRTPSDTPPRRVGCTGDASPHGSSASSYRVPLVPLPPRLPHRLLDSASNIPYANPPERPDRPFGWNWTLANDERLAALRACVMRCRCAGRPPRLGETIPFGHATPGGIHGRDTWRDGGPSFGLPVRFLKRRMFVRGLSGYCADAKAPCPLTLRAGASQLVAVPGHTASPITTLGRTSDAGRRGRGWIRRRIPFPFLSSLARRVHSAAAATCQCLSSPRAGGAGGHCHPVLSGAQAVSSNSGLSMDPGSEAETARMMGPGHHSPEANRCGLPRGRDHGVNVRASGGAAAAYPLPPPWRKGRSRDSRHFQLNLPFFPRAVVTFGGSTGLLPSKRPRRGPARAHPFHGRPSAPGPAQHGRSRFTRDGASQSARRLPWARGRRPHA
jgi:hypothetical protein